MSASIFTKIIRGEIPAHILYRDEKTCIFLDVAPVNPGHTLVVPVSEVDHLWDLPADDYQVLFETARKFARHMRMQLDAKRIGMMVEGFGVPHAHIHLLPINKGLAAELSKPKTPLNTPEDLAEMAAKLKVDKL